MNEIKRWTIDCHSMEWMEVDDGDMVKFSDHVAEIARLRAKVEVEIAAENVNGMRYSGPIGWVTEDYLTDKSATTYDASVADRWRAKGWPVTAIVLHSDHEAEVARLTEEIEGSDRLIRLLTDKDEAMEAGIARLRAEVEKYRKDAERWDHARKLLSVDDIAERQRTIEEWNYLISEDECKRADEAIDAAMGEFA